MVYDSSDHSPVEQEKEDKHYNLRVSFCRDLNGPKIWKKIKDGETALLSKDAFIISK